MVALTLGVAVMALYEGAALQLVKLTGCAAELWAPALLYLRVRALAMPANLVTMVAQAGARRGPSVMGWDCLVWPALASPWLPRKPVPWRLLLRR